MESDTFLCLLISIEMKSVSETRIGYEVILCKNLLFLQTVAHFMSGSTLFHTFFNLRISQLCLLISDR